MSFSMVVRMKTSLIMRRELARLVNCAVKWDTPRVNNKREEMIICGRRMYLQSGLERTQYNAAMIYLTNNTSCRLSVAAVLVQYREVRIISTLLLESMSSILVEVFGLSLTTFLLGFIALTGSGSGRILRLYQCGLSSGKSATTILLL